MAEETVIFPLAAKRVFHIRPFVQLDNLLPNAGRAVIG
jgi:hypothetical protein